MTMLVAWVGVDSRVPSSAYIATDSRISWTGGSAAAWDHGLKTFASRTQPDLFGYVGQVLLPTLFLARFVEALDLGAIGEGATLRDRQSLLKSHLRDAIENWPSTLLADKFTVVHVGRAGSGETSLFEIYLLRWSGTELTYQRLDTITASTVIKLGSTEIPAEKNRWVDGSGKSLMLDHLSKWQASEHGGTSRSVFSAFCDALAVNEVESVGGPPQLVGLRKRDCGARMGVYFGGVTYLAGMRFEGEQIEAECFNPLFERVNARGDRLKDAARHARPAGSTTPS